MWEKEKGMVLLEVLYVQWFLLVGQGIIILALGAALRNARRDARRHYDAGRTDALTGVANRLGLRERLRLAVSHALREGESLTVVCADANCLKAVNDTFDHATGDRLIQRMAQVLRETFARGTDTIGRLGGDEFAAVLVRTDDGQVPFAFRRLLSAADAAFIDVEGRAVGLSLSVGAASLRVDGERAWVGSQKWDIGRTQGSAVTDLIVATLLHEADRAMITAKRLSKEANTASGLGNVDGYPVGWNPLRTP